MIRQIEVDVIGKAVYDLVLAANLELPKDVVERLIWAQDLEESALGIYVIETLLKNARIARDERKPLCQDCGMVTVFIKIGSNVCIDGGGLEPVIQQAVADAYHDGAFRKSIVSEPMTRRINTGSNTPAIVIYEYVEGDRIEVEVLLKGGGSENMTRGAMLNPQAGRKGVARFILDTVNSAGAGACPPIVVTVGVGGTFDYASLMAKKALLRRLGERNEREDIAEFEEEMLDLVNKSGIGPGGLGGRITALDVKIEQYPTHIACLPVVVMLSCHAIRRAGSII